jgi:hypothetical protein
VFSCYLLLVKGGAFIITISKLRTIGGRTRFLSIILKRRYPDILIPLGNSIRSISFMAYHHSVGEEILERNGGMDNRRPVLERVGGWICIPQTALGARIIPCEKTNYLSGTFDMEELS